MELMTLDNPRWHEFTHELGSALTENRCRNDLFQARRLLREMEVDVEASVMYLEKHGGFCDCEVLMNVDR